MRNEILRTMFGGGSLDWDMLDKCSYNWEMVKQYDIIDMNFNSIIESCMEL